MQLKAAQCSSIRFTIARALARPLGERSEPLQLQGLGRALFMQFVGRCRDMLGAAVQCWSLLRSVPKLIKFQARFPFFVRQVLKKWLKRLHICQKLKIKVPHFGALPLPTTRYPNIDTSASGNSACTSAGAQNLCNTTTTRYQTTTYQLSELSFDLNWSSKSMQNQCQIIEIENQCTIIENQSKIIYKSLKTNIKSLKIYRKSMKIYAESIAVSVILWTASEASTAEISLKLLEIAQRFFN